MKNDNRKNILLRYSIVIFIIVVTATAVLVKLVNTTIVDARNWDKKAAEELSKTTVIQPERGNILAADGSVLAANLRFYTVRLDFRSEQFNIKRYINAIDSIADSMALAFPRRNSDQWKDYLLKPLTVKDKKKRDRSFPVVTNITYAELQRLKKFPFFDQRNRNRSGMTVDDYMRRVNPYGSMARRSIGGVGEDSNRQVHGISGLEMALDTLLFGKPGLARLVPMTRNMGQWTDIPPEPGYDIMTTIDVNVQDIVENELNRRLEYCNADWGVAVLMDVATGDIKAISNLEWSYKSNTYIEGMNRAVRGFEPGSVVKTLSMLIALEDGIVRPGDYLTTGRSWAYAGGRPITDAHGVDGLTVAEVIERSSNIGMAKIITRKYGQQPGAFYSRLRGIGFLDNMHTGIGGEKRPRIDSVPNSSEGRVALSRMCYGYATDIPPLYTLSIYNAIANGGRYVRPRLVSRLIGPETDSVLPVTYIRDRICSEKNAEILRGMLTNVVWGDHGTGKRLRNDLVRIAGKTGTCYMIENGQYNTSKKRLAFCGFFPADKPKYSCIVLIANPKQNAMGAASTSGEVLKEIALKLYSRGLLDNTTDYRVEGAQPHGAKPVYHASVADPKRPGELNRALGVGSGAAAAKAPAKGSGGRVPDVCGLSIREALTRLEGAGFNVAVSGAGMVRRQTPAAGTRARRGTRVILTMSN